MTEEFKEQLLKYITNDIQPTPSDNKELFLEQGLIDKTKWRPFLPEDWNNFRFEGMVVPDGNTEIGVLYGGYLDTDNNSRGIIILFDINFIPIKTIYTYDSGTPLRYIQYMKQADDGTFYFIDDNAFSYSQNQQLATSQKRFVMVDNFTIKSQVTNDYDVKLRKSYIFGNTYRNFYCRNMYKDPSSSHYILFGAAADTGNNYNYSAIKIIGLKVNVGEENEWTSYASTNDRIFGSAIASFEGENVKYRCLTTNNNTNNNNLVLYSKTYEGSPTSSTMVTFSSYKPYIDDIDYNKQSVFLDYDNVYFVQNNQQWGISGTLKPKYIGLYKYNIANSNLETIYEKYLGDYDYCNKEAIYIDKCDNKIYIEYNTNIDTSVSPVVADYYFQRLENDNWNPIKIANQVYFEYNHRSIFIKSTYNLLQVYLYGVNPRIVSAWYYYQIKEDYNSLNYNSLPYIDYNSLIANKGRIYSDARLVFARNLYNKTLLNNTTMATIQIPNGMLNNINIDNKNLLGETNLKLVQDNEVITKNIYETVFLNFINTINVIDEDTNTKYPIASTYINNNINIGTKANCEDTAVGKVRINYADNTTKIFNINWIDINHYNKITYYSLYVDKSIESLDYISNDESTVYCKRQIELDVGSFYTISQKIRTGKKVTAIQLQYNDEDIEYNSEPIMAYVEE